MQKKNKESTTTIKDKKVYIEEYDQIIETKTKDLKTKNKELGVIIKETEKEEQKLSEGSVKAAAKVEERLMKAYQKIRNTYKNGLAVVTVERDSCGGCFNKIPPQRQLEIRQRMKIIVCEHCGRILVDNNMANEVKKIVGGEKVKPARHTPSNSGADGKTKKNY